MFDDKRVTQEDIDRVHVRLRPLLGIAPGRWLAALYSLVILIILFLFLVLPGIRENGSIVSVDARPGGAAVMLDGAYAGTSPCSFFASRGAHRVLVSRPGFSSWEQVVEVRGRTFGSLIAPRRMNLEPRLGADDARSVLEAAFLEYSAWSLSGRPSAIYQMPLPLSEALLALDETGNRSSPATSEGPDFAASALAAASGEHAARDALRATFLAAAGGSPSPLGMVAGLETLERAVGSNPALVPWLESILPSASRERLSALAALGPGRNASRSQPQHVPPAQALSVGGLRFRYIAGGSFFAAGESPDGSSITYETSLPAYSIAETEVTRSQWAAFIAARSDWAPSNKAALVSTGLADESYLADWGIDRGDEPVTGVSWEAARAYCAWLSAKAPGGKAVELPSEAMWERAAQLGGDSRLKIGVFARADRKGPEAVGSSRDELGLSDMMGNVWEWCSDSFVPFPALAKAGSPWLGGERSVRGGSWANRQESVDTGSRGSFPPSFSSPFLGFRPVLVDKRTAR